MDAALAYARSGIYIVPWHPVKGDGPYIGAWPAFSSRDPEQIREWWERWPEAAIAGHVGRSGLVVFDVDTPANLPDLLRAHITAAPFQSTRRNDSERGHYVFRTPNRRFGNSTGALEGGWGEVRGANGVIILSPSPHEHADEGGRYRWTRRCEIPVLPEVLAEALEVAAPGESALSRPGLEKFLDKHTDADSPGRLAGQVSWFNEQVKAGESRHDSIVEALCWAFRESVVGAYSASHEAAVLADDEEW